MLGNFQADEAVQKAFTLEAMGQDKECSSGQEVFTELVREVKKLEETLLKIVGEKGG
jgi:hypothetical protein